MSYQLSTIGEKRPADRRELNAFEKLMRSLEES